MFEMFKITVCRLKIAAILLFLYIFVYIYIYIKLHIYIMCKSPLVLMVSLYSQKVIK